MFRFLSSVAHDCGPRRLAFIPAVCAIFLTSISGGTAHAQQLTAVLSGTAYDQTGAIIPNANIVVKNEASGDTRNTVSNKDGFFTFPALQPGTYNLTVSAPGFQSWQQKGIVLNQGDNRTLPNIALAVGQATQQVEVVAGAEAIAPVDTGEVSANLNQQMVTDLPLQGRNAGEFFKIMPGMALANGLSQGSSFNAGTVGTNSGPVGAYSANGTQPNGAIAYMFDGANLLDPGNQGTQIADINQDFTSEIKMLMSGYDAAYAKGPVVFQAYGKSGGAHFHGEAYFYARNNVFNSLDAFQRSQGITKPDAYEYYPGGNIGGPVLLPFTHFNRNRDKLFFWVGYEYMRQQPQGTLWQTFVPTAGMRNGDFGASAMAAIAALPGNHSAIDQVPCPAAGLGTRAGGCDSSKGPVTFVNGQIPTSMMDPNSLALLKLYPQPNVDPATHSGYNFQYLDQSPQNRWELMEKIDYALSDNTKITFSYNRQNETDLHPVQVWWAPAFSLPYPSPLVAPTSANVVMANVTHVFSPTTTNETVFTYAKYTNPIVAQNPSAITPSSIGYQTTGLFGVKEVQIPNIISWSGNQMFAGFDQQAVFGGGYHGGAFGKTASDPAIYDNFTKVAGTHTMKFGFYWDANGNQQSSGNQLNGTLDFETYGGTTTGNVYADFLLGRAAGYSQANIIPVDNLNYHQYSLYGQDSWKVTKNLTVNYGLRADHIGQWYPDTSYGAAVFNVGAFLANVNAANAGLQWHSINNNIPISGFKSPLFYYEPRIGAAYDVFGNGKTVLRGGFAIFRYQLAYNTISGPSELPEGAITYNSPAITSLSQISTFSPPTSVVLSGCNSCSISPLQMGDGKTPYTENYNFSVDRQMPWQMLAEVSYVGNRSRDLLLASGSFDNLNPVPYGAFFGPDPVTGVLNPINSISNSNDYRRFQSYGDINITTHGSYANYNSLQATLQKNSGPVTLMVNYTFGKVMGIRDNYSGNGPSAGNTVDPFNIHNNYGVLGFNHTHILNSGFVFTLPRLGQGWVDRVAGGWQLSGTTSFQTGAPIQPNTNGTMNATYGAMNFTGCGGTGQPGCTVTINGHTLPVSGNSVGLSTGTNLGNTNTNEALVPLLTCNPMANLKSGQYFNSACFAPPPLGSNGTLVWPNIHGPAFFDADMNIMKNFRITESQKVQLRFSAFNFLNRPNPQFGAGGNGDITLNFAGSGNALSQTNTNALTTGYPAHTVGNRVVEFAVKYYF
jgi:hypothetical protein